MWYIEYLSEVGSTNDAAREGRRGHGYVVVAGTQTAGRGQQGNSWVSAPGENLTFSVVLAPDFLPVGDQFLLSEAVSLAIADALAECGIDARIKWPNDIYVGDRKIAGILIENDIKGGTMHRSIAGIGLNVNQIVFPASLPNPTSMKLAAGREFDLREVLGSILGKLGERYDALASGRAAGIESDYHSQLYRAGEPAPYSTPDGQRFTGVIKQVGQSGELTMEHADGTLHSYLFKEVEFII